MLPAISMVDQEMIMRGRDPVARKLLASAISKAPTTIAVAPSMVVLVWGMMVPSGASNVLRSVS
jgi:hypothetical protein